MQTMASCVPTQTPLLLKLAPHSVLGSRAPPPTQSARSA